MNEKRVALVTGVGCGIGAAMACMIDAGRSIGTVPWQMGVAARVMGWMPNWLYDWMASKAGRKSRALKL